MQPERSLDEYYRRINSIFLDRNFYRSPSSIFAHLVEIVGALSLLASEKKKAGVDPQGFVAKAVAWWFALCGKQGVRSVEDMLWAKFPFVCPYCMECPHDTDKCEEARARPNPLSWSALEKKGKERAEDRPKTLGAWQRMFAVIYPIGPVEDYGAAFARCTEELGELAEALRVFAVAPGYFLSEAADVFAWLMHLVNLMERKQGLSAFQRGRLLENTLWRAYPDKCNECDNPLCTCPPVLQSTLGRIAHDVPPGRGSFKEGGALIPPDEVLRLFELGSRSIKLGNEVHVVTPELISEIHQFAKKMLQSATESKDLQHSVNSRMIEVLRQLEQLASAQRVTQESVDELLQAIEQMTPEGRTALIGFLTSLGAGAWIETLQKIIEEFVRS